MISEVSGAQRTTRQQPQLAGEQPIGTGEAHTADPKMRYSLLTASTVVSEAHLGLLEAKGFKTTSVNWLGEGGTGTNSLSLY